MFLANKASSITSKFLLVFLLVACAARVRPQAVAASPDLPVVGWIEDVLIEPFDFTIQAKLDTGADKSSLHASNIEEFNKDGKDFVRFDLRNRRGEVQALELEAYKTTSIRRIQDKAQRRIVVRVPLCLAGHKIDVDVTLVDRSNLSVPMLIGRNFLAGNVVVDSSKTYLSQPMCKD